MSTPEHISNYKTNSWPWRQRNRQEQTGRRRTILLPPPKWPILCRVGR